MNNFLHLINWKTAVLLIILALGVYTFLKRGDTADKETVKEWINNGALIVDVRTPQEFAAGNYPGSINIPLAEIEQKLSLLGEKERKIIVYCRTGNRSGQAKKILQSKGYINVINGGGLTDMPR